MRVVEACLAKLVAVALVICPFGATRIFAQSPSFRDVVSRPALSSPMISPDGSEILYTRTVPDWKKDGYDTQIWKVNVSTCEKVRITDDTGGSSPAWSPDGKWISFTSSRSGENQVYLADTHGGRPVPLTKTPGGIDDYMWSPTGKQIALWVDFDDPEVTRRSEELGDFQIWGLDANRLRMGVVNVPDALPAKAVDERFLTDGRTFSVGSMDWSPDGKTIAFDATASTSAQDLKTRNIYTVSVADMTLKQLTKDGPAGQPIWSPDGSTLAFYTLSGKPFMYTLWRLATMPADGGAVTIRSQNFDEGVEPVAWTQDGILFISEHGANRHLFRFDPASGKVDSLSTPDSSVCASYSLTKDNSTCAYISYADNRLGEVAVSPVRSFQERLVTHDSDAGLSGAKLPKYEMVRWKSKDGVPIEGVLITPRDFNPKVKYPLLVEIHGGPGGATFPVSQNPYSDATAYPLEQFVNKGAIVLMPNYRGSAGYGQKFRALNVRNLGFGDEADILSGVDFLIKQGFVDEHRLGCMGWSHGGFLSAFIATNSPRFKAFSVGACIADWTTQYTNSDTDESTKEYMAATPWSGPDIYKKTSPISYVKHVKTPILIQQGLYDKRVPLANSFEFYHALQDLGVPSKLVLYKGGHVIYSPKEQTAAMLHNWEWFTKYLWGE